MKLASTRKVTDGSKVATRFSKSAFKLPSVLLISASIGGGAGFYLHSMLKPTITVVEGDADAYAPDIDAIMTNYNKVKNSGGDYCGKLKAYEIVNAAYEIFSTHTYTYSIGVGASVAMGLVNQRIESAQIKEGERYFEESNSTSTYVRLFNRMYQEGEKTTKYWGSNTDYSKDKPEEVSNETYAEQMGRNVSVGLTYLVSEGTESSEDKSGKGLTSVTQDSEGYITVNFEAKPDATTLRYVKQMKTISNLKTYPSFEYVHLTWKMDKDLNLIWFNNYEKYHATLSTGIGSDCAGSMTTIYKYGEACELSIPTPSEQLPSYPSTEEELISQYCK